MGVANQQLFTELGIESGYVLMSEMRKDLATWAAEAEFGVSDFVVGVALDVLVVTILAPAAALGKGGATRAMLKAGARPTGLLAGARRALAGLPSSCFAAAPKGLKYNAAQRAAAFVVRGLELAVVGAGCGFVGQLGANTAMKLRRGGGVGGEEEEAVAVVPPPLLNTAVVWGVFMGVSANSRFQVGRGWRTFLFELAALSRRLNDLTPACHPFFQALVGLERVLEGTVLVQKQPLVAAVGIVTLRLLNNVVGGEHFVEMARAVGL